MILIIVENASNDRKKRSELEMEDEKKEEKKLELRNEEAIILLLPDSAEIHTDLEPGKIWNPSED